MLLISQNTSNTKKISKSKVKLNTNGEKKCSKKSLAKSTLRKYQKSLDQLYKVLQ
jgi:hypothetical protein